MKRLWGIVMASALLGCAAEEPVRELNIQLERENDQPRIIWQKLPGEAVRYDVTLSTVSGSDAGKTGTMVFHTETAGDSFNGTDAVAWYAQENEYYGPMKYTVAAYEGETAAARGESETFMAGEFFPAEKEIALDAIKLDSIEQFSYNGTGDASDLIFTFDFRKTEEGIMAIADYSDAEGHHEYDGMADAAFFNGLRPWIERGSLQRRHVREPDLVVLDETSEWFTLTYEGENSLQKMWYEFVPNDEADKEAIIRYLKQNAAETGNDRS